MAYLYKNYIKIACKLYKKLIYVEMGHMTQSYLAHQDQANIIINQKDDIFLHGFELDCRCIFYVADSSELSLASRFISDWL